MKQKQSESSAIHTISSFPSSLLIIYASEMPAQSWACRIPTAPRVLCFIWASMVLETMAPWRMNQFPSCLFSPHLSKWRTKANTWPLSDWRGNSPALTFCTVSVNKIYWYGWIRQTDKILAWIITDCQSKFSVKRLPFSYQLCFLFRLLRCWKQSVLDMVITQSMMKSCTNSCSNRICILR